MHITRSAVGAGGPVGIPGSIRPQGCEAGRRVGHIVVEQEQLPDFRITGSVPPKVLLVRSQNPEPTEPQASVFA